MKEGGALKLVLVTGGVRSGKSCFAEELARQAGTSVLYVATGQAWDEEMRLRIRRHQERRPDDWGLAEIGCRLNEMLPAADSFQTVLLDCLSTWVGSRLMQVPEERIRDQAITDTLLREADEWLEEMARGEQTVIVVSAEVGLGGVALTSLGRWFADVLGELNQRVARRADKVYAVWCGIPWRIK
jgi:adenosylcobinamide kinase/adenosylcobinamide-phosphate guanylyltransferase